MTISVPTLSFGTIRRLSLLNIFAYAKIDCRYLDFGASLIAIDIARRIHEAGLVRTVIVADHRATRVDVAAEIGSIAIDIATRTHAAANITKDLLYMVFFYTPVFSFN